MPTSDQTASFTIRSDDQGYLTIDGQNIISSAGNTISNSKYLLKGSLYDAHLRFVEDQGKIKFMFSWSYDGEYLAPKVVSQIQLVKVECNPAYYENYDLIPE